LTGLQEGQRIEFFEATVVRRRPSHHSQGDPPESQGDSPEAPHVSDSLPLQSPGEAEITLFTIPGRPAQGAKVLDVRGAHRLMLPDLDLTASAELQALATSLMRDAARAHAADQVPSSEDLESARTGQDMLPARLPDAPAAEVELSDLPLRTETSEPLGPPPDDPELERFDETALANAALPNAATRRTRDAGRMSGIALALFLSGASWLESSRRKAHHAWSKAVELPATLTTLVRRSAGAIPLGDVLRVATIAAALATIALVVVRLDWTRRLEPSGQVPDTESVPLLRADAIPVRPFAPIAQLALPLDDAVPGADFLPLLPDPAETRVVDLRRNSNEEPTRSDAPVPAARRPQPAASAQTARRSLLSDAVDASASGTPPASLDPVAPSADRPAAPSVAPGPAAARNVPDPPIADAVRAEAAPVETPATAPERSSSTSPRGETDAIVAALSQLELAYGRRDANLAKAIWPTVDARALSRAFGSLRSQSVEFDRCNVKVTGGTGEVECRGTTTYVPRVGNQFARTESRQWMFRLEKGSERWLITRAAAR
jgi:hypothetical protein